MATQSVNRSSPIAYSCTNLLNLPLDPLRFILKYLTAAEIFPLKFVCKKFAAIDLVKNAKPKQQDLILLAVKTSLEFGKWITPLIFNKHELFSNAVKYGNLPLLIWLKEQKIDSDECGEYFIEYTECMEIAARGGHLDTIKWLNDNNFKWDETVTQTAAKHGHFELLKWLRHHGFPWDSSTLKESLSLGNLEMTTWLLDNRCPFPRDYERDSYLPMLI